MIQTYADGDMGEVRAAVTSVGCLLLDEFTWVVGGNWVVTPYGVDPVVNDELASTLGGELIVCP